MESSYTLYMSNSKMTGNKEMISKWIIFYVVMSSLTVAGGKWTFKNANC